MLTSAALEALLKEADRLFELSVDNDALPDEKNYEHCAPYYIAHHVVKPLASALRQLLSATDKVWPDLVAPPQHENPAPGWEDPRVPDLRLIWKLAKEVGYAIGVHGSLKRDFDIIAAPWTETAVGNAELVDHLCAGLNARRVGGPEHKPHGRVAVTLQIDGWFKPIDLSICSQSATDKEPITTIPPIHADLLNENWHAITGPNGQCECGVEKGVCGDRLKRFVWVQIKSQGDDIGGQGLSATEEAAFKAGLETERVYAGEGGWEWFHKPSGRIAKTAEGALEIYRQSKAGSVKS